MFTKEDLIRDLKAMGIQSTDALMVHSSMKSIGDVEGGADTVVDAFMEYLADGLFMTPTHTWAQMSAEYNIFDPKTEPACVGVIPNIFKEREGVVRSLHPTHSIAAYGRGLGLGTGQKIVEDVSQVQSSEKEACSAADYIQGEEFATTPCPPGGCWDRLREIRAKILLVGVTHARNTYIHSVDEVFDVQERLTAEPTLMRIVMPDGSLKDVWMHRHYNPVSAHISDNFDKLSDAFYELGAARKVKFGDADCILCDAAGLFGVYSKVLAHEENSLIEREVIPETWWR